MNESLISRIIHAAQTGKLTEEQYEVYLRLLEEDPDLQDLIKWEVFLDKYLPLSNDAGLYEAVSKIKFPRERSNQRRTYAVAAGVALLFLSGWFGYRFLINGDDRPSMISQARIEFFIGDTISTSGLNYSEQGLAVGEKVLRIWEVKSQKESVDYKFCKDTLQLYFKDLRDTIALKAKYRLTYFSNSDSYYLVSKPKKPIKIILCSFEPQPLIK